MSTREGTGIDLDDLLDEAIDRARDEVETRLDGRTRDDDLDEADIDRIARQVGIGAVRYDIVSKQPTKPSPSSGTARSTSRPSPRRTSSTSTRAAAASRATWTPPSRRTRP